MDRLLSEREARIKKFQFSSTALLFKEYVKTEESKLTKYEQALLEAQRDLTAAAANAEWVEWIKKYKLGCSTGECEFYAGCPTELAGYYCKAWQERKRSVGL